MRKGILLRGLMGLAALAALALACAMPSAIAVEVTADKPAPEATGPVELKIGLVFPAETRDGVPVLTAAVMVNDRRVLPAGTVLYTLYQIPKPDDKDTKAAQHKLDRKEAYSRTEHLRGVETRTAADIALRERALKTRWPSDIPFRAMLNVNFGRDMFLVFAGAGGEAEIEAVEFPEGLLLWDRGEGPEVGFVQPEGGGQQAGFQRGDRIVSIAGQAAASLAEFQRQYLAGKTGNLRGRSLKVEVRPASGGAAVVRELRAPPSLMGSFLDMPPE